MGHLQLPSFENLSSIDYRYNKPFINYKDLNNKIKKIKLKFFARKEINASTLLLQ